MQIPDIFSDKDQKKYVDFNVSCCLSDICLKNSSADSDVAKCLYIITDFFYHERINPFQNFDI